MVFGLFLARCALCDAKLAHISNVFIKKLITHGYDRKRERFVGSYIPKLGTFTLARDFYKLLLGEVGFNEEVENTLNIKENFSDVILERMLDEAEHGF